MFPVNCKYTEHGYEYIELIVHGDLLTYRRPENTHDMWETYVSGLGWQYESTLSNIIDDLFASYPANYFWLDDYA